LSGGAALVSEARRDVDHSMAEEVQDARS